MSPPLAAIAEAGEIPHSRVRTTTRNECVRYSLRTSGADLDEMHHGVADTVTVRASGSLPMITNGSGRA